MAQNVEIVYRDRETIVAEIIAAWQARIVDIETGPDSIIRIWSEVFGESAEGLYLAMQLLHDDIFIQTMNALALVRAGEMYGRSQKGGTQATGDVRITGVGGAFVGTDTIIGSPRASLDDTLLFSITTPGTIPNPGIPTAPVIADGGAGNLAAGTYEYGVTFMTPAGETEIGAISDALLLPASHLITVSGIPLGGPGTIGRSLYRRVDGGAWQKNSDPTIMSALNNNSTTTVSDNLAVVNGGPPPDDSTAESIVLSAQAQDVGSEYNVAIGAITEINDGSTIGSLTGVSNTTAFTGGEDLEDIEVFRSALLAWVQAPASGSALDLEVWAESVDGVEDATVFPNVNLAGTATPGTVTVRISGPDGSVPPADVIANVQSELDSHDLANIVIVVGTFTPNPVNVTAVLTLASGYVLADVTPSVIEAITDYINDVPVGGTVYTSGLVDSIFGLPGVVTVSVTVPAPPGVTSTTTQKPTLGTVSLS